MDAKERDAIEGYDEFPRREASEAGPCRKCGLDMRFHWMPVGGDRRAKVGCSWAALIACEEGSAA